MATYIVKVLRYNDMTIYYTTRPMVNGVTCVPFTMLTSERGKPSLSTWWRTQQREILRAVADRLES